MTAGPGYLSQTNRRRLIKVTWPSQTVVGHVLSLTSLPLPFGLPATTVVWKKAQRLDFFLKFGFEGGPEATVSFLLGWVLLLLHLTNEWSDLSDGFFWFHAGTL